MDKRDLLYINSMFRALAISTSHATLTATRDRLTFEDIAEVGKRTNRRFDILCEKIVADDTL